MKKILIPTDFSDCARRAEETATVYQAQREWAETTLAARASEIRATGVSAHGIVRSGVAVDEILKLATEEGCDLIIIGTHGRGGLSRFFLGSVADRVVRLAPCPVMTVRLPSEETRP